MSTALVEMFNSQPMTTSLAIADGIEMPHSSVIKLVRRYIKELSEFNPIRFEIQNGRFEIAKSSQSAPKSDLKSDLGGEVAFQMRLNAQGSPTEYALLNEGQAMFLLTLQKNTTKVVQFKLALVKAFLELRDRLTQTAPHTKSPLNLNHRADIRVAADRTFRSVMRACRSAGAKLPQALARANEVTLRETGIDILTDYQIAIPAQAGIRQGNHIDFLTLWMQNQLPVPCMVCKSAHVYLAYQHWARLNDVEIMSINQVNADISRFCGFKIKTARIGYGGGIQHRLVIPHGNWFAENKTLAFTQYVEQFQQALNEWKSQTQ